MPALNTTLDSSGRLTLQPSLRTRLGGVASMAGWLVFLAIFLLPSLSDRGIDWTTMLMVGLFLVVTVGGAFLSVILVRQVIIDPTTQALLVRQQLLTLPLGSAETSMRDLASVDCEYYRQSAGRTSHDAWRVVAVGKEGKRILLNWDGKKEEMAALAEQVGMLTRAPVVDRSLKPVSTVQQILESMQGKVSEPSAQDAGGEEQGGSAMPSSGGEMQGERSLADAPTAEPAPHQMSSTAPYSPQEEDATAPETAATPAERSVDLNRLSREELAQRISSDSMDSDARFALAHKYHENRSIDQAIPLYLETLRIDTTNAEAQNDLGVAYWQKGKRSEAEVAFRRAIALDPFLSTAHLNLGLLLRLNKRAVDASQEFYQARQNARSAEETRYAEAASTGGRVDPQLAGPRK